MAKIFSILTLLIAAGAAYLGFQSEKLVKNLQEAGDRTQKTLVRTETKLKSTEKELEETKKTLEETKAELETTKTKLRETEAELSKTKMELTTTKGELDKVNAEIADIKKAIEEVLPGQGLQGIASLKTTITELTTKSKELETKVANLEKDKATLEATVATLEVRNKELDGTVSSQKTVISRYKDNIMQKGVRGTVLAVNAGWGFCVLSIGDKQGAASNKVMIVARGGQAIGKVKITNVESSQSVADIMSGTFVKGLYVQPGDSVIFTGEDKVKVEDQPSNAPVTPQSVAAPALPQP